MNISINISSISISISIGCEEDRAGVAAVQFSRARPQAVGGTLHYIRYIWYKALH